MAGIKSLAKDTIIYGLSSILGRFLNWLLVPLYTRVFVDGQYGVVTNLYAYVAITLAVLTYGLETGFFRFINRKDCKDPMRVYSTCLLSLAVSSTAFVILLVLFLHPISRAMGYADHSAYILMLGISVAVDAFTCIPFGFLRNQNKPLKFAILKFVNIGLNIGLNLFFLLVVYEETINVGYIFFVNLITSIATLFMLWKELTGFRWQFDNLLWKRLMKYSFPLLILSVAGIMNQNLDKILFPYFAADGAMTKSLLGIYGACCKIGLIMMMFTQAFRFAFEPRIFNRGNENHATKLQEYSDATKYFVVFCMFIFLGVTFYLPIIKYLIGAEFRSGLFVVPIIMMGEVFFGIFFNLSTWYKISDKTIWGTWFSLLGLIITIGMNYVLVPRIGFAGCAWAGFACYGVMMLASYFVGQKKSDIRYPVGRILFYMLFAVVFWSVGTFGMEKMFGLKSEYHTEELAQVVEQLKVKAANDSVNKNVVPLEAVNDSVIEAAQPVAANDSVSKAVQPAMVNDSVSNLAQSAGKAAGGQKKSFLDRVQREDWITIAARTPLLLIYLFVVLLFEPGLRRMLGGMLSKVLPWKRK